MTQEKLEKLLAKATPGTWSVTDEHEILSVETCNDPIDGEPYENRTLIAQGECTQNWGYIEWFNLADAVLIVAAVNALPELLAKVKRYESMIRVLLENEPDDAVSDGGHTVLDLWLHEARAALKETGQ